VNVTVIDDDDDLRASLAGVLQDYGHHVDSFARAEDALAALNDGLRPALILLDLMMPGMNGWELREKILEDPRLAAIPLVVVTARTAGDASLKSLGRTQVLFKPFALEALLEVLEERRPSSSASPA
jgi:CheY-like chemotaxis protein